MTHPALLILAKNPEILADHAEAYTDLIAESVKSMVIDWRRRAICDVAIAICLLLFMVFAGVAAMLWGTSTTVNIQGLYLLFGVPLLPLLVAIALWLFSSKRSYRTAALELVKQQVRADLAVLRRKNS